MIVVKRESIIHTCVHNKWYLNFEYRCTCTILSCDPSIMCSCSMVVSSPDPTLSWGRVWWLFIDFLVMHTTSGSIGVSTTKKTLNSHQTFPCEKVHRVWGWDYIVLRKVIITLSAVSSILQIMEVDYILLEDHWMVDVTRETLELLTCWGFPPWACIRLALNISLTVT